MCRRRRRTKAAPVAEAAPRQYDRHAGGLSAVRARRLPPAAVPRRPATTRPGRRATSCPSAAAFPMLTGPRLCKAGKVRSARAWARAEHPTVWRDSRVTTSLLVLAAFVAAGPAAAQFGSIFNQPPPRPPADVPSAPPPPSDRRAPPPFFPSREPAVRSDEPPQQPLPAPMSLPPQNRPGAGRHPARRNCRRRPAPSGRRGRRRSSRPFRCRPCPACRPASVSRPARRSKAISRRRTRRRAPRATERSRGRAAAAAHRQSDRGVLRPRQDHRPHHLVRRRDRRDRAVRRAAGDAARLLFAAADRDAADRLPSSRSTRSRCRARSSASSPAGCSPRAPACTRSSIRSTTSG